jgi:hypothetical protein
VGVDEDDVTHQRNGHRVDREVAPREVVLERRRRHRRERARVGVGLGAGAREVDLEFVELHGCGPEALVLGHLSTERGGEAGDVVLGDEVDVGALRPEQEVANGAADEVDGGRAELRAQLGDPRQRLEALGKF